MPDCGVHYLWFAFVCFLIRSHPPIYKPTIIFWSTPNLQCTCKLASNLNSLSSMPGASTAQHSPPPAFSCANVWCAPLRVLPHKRMEP